MTTTTDTTELLAPPDPSTRSVAAASPTADKRRITPTRLALTAAVLLLGAAAITVASLALFTDTATVTGNTFSSGTVDISATPASAVVSLPAMAPGDQTTAPLTVGNLGSLALRYAVRSTTTEDVLAGALVLTIKSGVTTCNNANWSASGTTLYTGRLGSVASDALIGSVATGANPGDRALASGASEVLCVNVTLPTAATVGQGATTTATFDFVAEQTANNP
jgi:predicted ribosomally synthesized peptide with SipW-like signal peptide